VIAPFVGTIPPGYSFAPSEREVAEVLEVPVRSLADRRNARNESRLFEGTVAQSPAFAYQGNLIFGATARVLRGFIDLVDREPSENPLWKN
jgi:hypothetical protein